MALVGGRRIGATAATAFAAAALVVAAAAAISSAAAAAAAASVALLGTHADDDDVGDDDGVDGAGVYGRCLSHPHSRLRSAQAARPHTHRLPPPITPSSSSSRRKTCTDLAAALAHGQPPLGCTGKRTADFGDFALCDEGARILSAAIRDDGTPGLARVVLSVSGLTVAGVGAACQAVCAHPSVSHLSLLGVRANRRLFAAIAYAVGTSTSIRHLEIWCEAEAAGIDELCAELLRNESIQSISLSFKQFEAADAAVLARVLKFPNSRLTGLTISSTYVNKAGIKTLASALRRNRSLRKLDISYRCACREEQSVLRQSVASIFSSLLAHPALMSITFSSSSPCSQHLWNKERPLGDGSVGAAVGALLAKPNSPMRRLRLAMPLSESDAQSLFTSLLHNNTTLQELRIDHSAIGASVADVLAEILARHPTLHTVSLPDNDFSPAAVFRVVSGVKRAGTRSRIKTLDVRPEMALDGMDAVAALAVDVVALLLPHLRLAELHIFPRLAPILGTTVSAHYVGSPLPRGSVAELYRAVARGGYWLVDADIMEWYPAHDDSRPLFGGGGRHPPTDDGDDFDGDAASAAADDNEPVPAAFFPGRDALCPSTASAARRAFSRAVAARRADACRALLAVGRLLVRLVAARRLSPPLARVVVQSVADAVNTVTAGAAAATAADDDAAAASPKLFSAQELAAMVDAVLDRGSLGRLGGGGIGEDDAVLKFDAHTFVGACRSYIARI
ncbi:hypothetical protein DFJ73DRAFT_772219 [Zopfochytrium polystomum]|nr:hypothetical protein DFJ73DRAFT_772219 [Zopfochytrium polystomum]